MSKPSAEDARPHQIRRCGSHETVMVGDFPTFAGSIHQPFAYPETRVDGPRSRPPTRRCQPALYDWPTTSQKPLRSERVGRIS